MLLFSPEKPPVKSAWVHVLDVGQGLAVVVQTHSHVLLYDTGPGWSDQADSGSRIIVPYLRGEGVRALDGLVVTHADNDHSGGALSVLDALPVGWLLSSLPATSPIVGRSTDAMRCHAGQRWNWDGVEFTVLHPAAETYAEDGRKTNDRSCVIKVATATQSMLLTGDIEARSEAEILARDEAMVRADILIAPHHGSRTSSTSEFIAAVAPKEVVYTVGYRNRFGHPRAEIVERYSQSNARAWRSDRDGEVFIRLDGTSDSPRAWREQEPRYWWH
jgi:competence protein ComEC